jgi:hypothetical protein
MNQLTIFSVATDRYLSFWLDLVNSGNLFLDKDLKVQWIIFTNRESEIPAAIYERLGESLITVPFKSAPWPMPTLLRYELLNSIKDRISGDFIMHLDADMLFINPLSRDDLVRAIGKKKIALTRHPGFYRPFGSAKVKFYLRNFSYILRDLKLLLLNGGIGSWEKNPNSLAFISRNKRKVYVCGGTWFGERESIIELCHLLSGRIRKELLMNVVAKYHDESHLNWYAANNDVSICSPEFCFEISYPQLIGINPKIIAVDKGNGLNWER